MALDRTGSRQAQAKWAPSRRLAFARAHCTSAGNLGTLKLGQSKLVGPVSQSERATETRRVSSNHETEAARTEDDRLCT